MLTLNWRCIILVILKQRNIIMRKISHIPTTDTSKDPDCRIAHDYAIVGRNNVIRFNNDEKVARVNGRPIHFPTVEAAKWYAEEYRTV